MYEYVKCVKLSEKVIKRKDFFVFIRKVGIRNRTAALELFVETC